MKRNNEEEIDGGREQTNIQTGSETSRATNVQTVTQSGRLSKSNVVQRDLYLSTTSCVVTVVKIFWTHEAQLSESTINFDHCDDAYLLSIRVQVALNHIDLVHFLPYYQRQRK